ncbi:MAG: hypothetical protein Q4Q28_07490 [Bacteroidales bacterium]|nr:hypothetical protein [Bacteroidales bacterium]
MRPPPPAHRYHRGKHRNTAPSNDNVGSRLGATDPPGTPPHSRQAPQYHQREQRAVGTR